MFMGDWLEPLPQSPGQWSGPGLDNGIGDHLYLVFSGLLFFVLFCFVWFVCLFVFIFAASF